VAFEQYLFRSQWNSLKRYANRRGVALFGDMPFYVDMNSVDVWWRRDLFQIDENGNASVVAGVPPDYFSQDGQLWGNPIYDWDRMRAEGYQWWRDRLGHQLRQFDMVRIDHFRAIESYWAIPGDATSAREGEWRQGPGDGLLEAVGDEVPLDAVVAEDLGIITPEVRELRDRFGLAGMLVLQFAFDGSADNPFLPVNHIENAVVYTGTHDNDTTLGWYASLDDNTRRYMREVLGDTHAPMPDGLIQAALASPARLAMLPMQDLLGLDSSARMNSPGTASGNWTWRFGWDQVPAGLGADYLARLATTRRCPHLKRAASHPARRPNRRRDF
jgi:4-alpha-glucanotransferase